MTDGAREWSKRLGTVGVWTHDVERMPVAGAGDYVHAIESLGFAALWIPESLGSKEAFAHAGLLLGATKKLLEGDLARPFPGMGYRQYPRLREEIQSLSGSNSRAPTRPTDPEILRMKELQQELDEAVSQLNRIQTGQIGQINEMMKAAPYIVMEIVR